MRLLLILSAIAVFGSNKIAYCENDTDTTLNTVEMTQQTTETFATTIVENNEFGLTVGGNNDSAISIGSKTDAADETTSSCSACSIDDPSLSSKVSNVN